MERHLQGAVEKLAQPKETFEALYNHFLQLADSVAMPHGSTKSAAGHSMSTAFVEGDAEEDRLLCVRAMAALYNHHAAAIGMSLTCGWRHSSSLIASCKCAAYATHLLSSGTDYTACSEQENTKIT